MKNRQKGFTIVELLVVAPTVLLAISAFVVVIVTMVGEAVSTRSLNVITYQTQEALSRIDQDVRSSVSFLAETSIEFTSSNPQGYGNHGSTTPFTNVGANGPMLILNMPAITDAPKTPNNSYVYLWEDPLDCSSSNIGNFPIMQINVVYYIKDNTLWRRTVTPINYTTAGCKTPWQLPSCQPGYSSEFCKTDDEKLLTGISPEDFQIQYFESAASTTELDGAVNAADDAATRQEVLDTAKAIHVSIESNHQVSGRDVSYSGNLIARLQLKDIETEPSTSEILYMQNITKANCPTERTLAVDARDNHTYWVQKLTGDGGYSECWMLTNLAYGGDGTNTYGDTMSLTEGYDYYSSWDTPIYYVTPNTTNFTSYPTNPSTSTNGLGQFGFLYNWCAAMGGQNTAACDNGMTPSPDPNISICPSGWRLPSSSEFQLFASSIGATNNSAGSNNLRSIWLAQLGGGWDDEFYTQESWGYYWSSSIAPTEEITHGLQLIFGSSNVYSSSTGVKYWGAAVRCIID